MAASSRDPFRPDGASPPGAGDDDADLEAGLKRLRPGPVPAALASRLRDALADPTAVTGGSKARSAVQPESAGASNPPRPAPSPEDGLSFGPSGWGWLWAPAAVAAAILVVVLVDRRWVDAPSPDAVTAGTVGGEVEVGPDGQFMDPQIARISNVNARSFLYDAIDDGIVLTDSNRAVRQYRYRFLETVVLQNPEDGSTLTMDIPREEIVRVPVQTF